MAGARPTTGGAKRNSAPASRGQWDKPGDPLGPLVHGGACFSLPGEQSPPYPYRSWYPSYVQCYNPAREVLKAHVHETGAPHHGRQLRSGRELADRLRQVGVRVARTRDQAADPRQDAAAVQVIENYLEGIRLAPNMGLA